MISAGLATMADLGTVLGAEDLYDLFEVAVVNAHNRRVLDKKDD